MDKETAIETVLIVAFFTAMLYLGPGTASEHRITHEFPTGYSASDSYQHQVRTEAIRQAGQYKYEAPYMVVGLTDVIGFYPPVLYNVAVLLADVSHPLERARVIGSNDTFAGAANTLLAMMSGPVLGVFGMPAIAATGILLMVVPFFMIVKLEEG